MNSLLDLYETSSEPLDMPKEEYNWLKGKTNPKRRKNVMEFDTEGEKFMENHT